MLFSQHPNEGETRGQWALCISQPHPMPSRKTATENSSTAPPTSDAILTAEIRCAAKYSRRHIRWVRGLFATMLIYDPVLWLVVTCLSGESLSRRPEPFTTQWYDKLFANSDWIEPSDEAVSLAVAIVVGAVTQVAGTIAGRATPRLWRGGVVLLINSAIPLLVRGVVSRTAEFLYLRSFLGFRFRGIERPLPMPGIVPAGLVGFLSLLNELAQDHIPARPHRNASKIPSAAGFDAQLQRAADLCS
jgi:hypothetical protein